MTARKKKTAWDKVTELMQLHPNNPALKTALRHFSDDALLRELQRRDAMPGTDSAGHLGDANLCAECLERGVLVIPLADYKRAIDEKDWEAIENFYWEVN